MTDLYKKLSLLILLHFVTVIVNPVSGQNNFWGETETEIKFKHLSTEQGLSSNVTSIIIKDSQGYIWIGTDAGLNRFDGFEVKTFKYGTESENQLSNGVIKALHEDTAGNIWIGTDKGLNLYNPIDESITHFFSEANYPGSLSNNTITSITEDKKGNLWFGTFYGLNKLTEWIDGKPSFQRFYSEFQQPNTIGNNRIYCLFSDSKDNLWIGTEGGGLSLLEAENKNSENYQFKRLESQRRDNSKLSESVIFTVNEDEKGNIYIGSDHGFTIINNKGLNPVFKHYLPKENTPNWFSEEKIFSIEQDKSGKVWIGTFGSGIYIFNQEKNTFKQYKREIFNPQSLSRDFIFSIYSANDGLLWIAPRETGIDWVDPQMQQFIHLKNIPNNPNSLSHNVIKSIMEGPDGKFWFATFGGGLNVYDPADKSYHTFNHENDNPSSLCSNIVESICFDHLDRVWIGTAKGLNMYNPKTKSMKRFVNNPYDENSITDANIWCVYPARDKSGIWIGTYNGLDKYDWNENRFYHLKNNPRDTTSLSFNFIRALYEDKDRNLWVCTWGGGLEQLKLSPNQDLDSVKFIHHKNNQGENSISNDLVNTIYEDSKGDLWIGTQSGLNLYNKKTGIFKSYFEKDGLADNVIKAILEDNNGNMWISTQKGLSRFDLASNKFINYYHKDGLQGNIFNLSSCLKNSRGELMFGGNSGINIFYPQKIEIKRDFPEVYLKDIEINNQKVKPGHILNNRVLLKTCLNTINKIELNHNENLIKLSFSAIEYSHPERISFAYKLEGVDKNWNITTFKNRAVTYAGLKKGKYQFKVKTSNIYGDWNNKVKTIDLQIHPPWYKTNFAYFVYSLLVVLISYLIGKLILARIKMKRELAQEKIERKRQAELDNFKLQFFTNISHEIRTPLTLIAGPLQKLINRNPKMPGKQIDAQLSVMNRSVSILTKLVNQLLDFRKAEKGRIKLQIRYFDIYKQLKSHIDDFNDYATEKNLTLDFKSNFNSLNFWYDIDIFEKIFFNLMSNAVKFTPAGGKICISLKNAGEIELPENTTKNKNDYFCFSVEDTGIGISAENQKHIFERFYQIDAEENNNVGTGIGLSFTKVLTERHHGFIDVQSTPKTGSKFTVWLPATKRFFESNQIITEEEANHSYLKSQSSFTTIGVETSEKAELALKGETKNITLLIVEDNSELSNFIYNMFIDKYNVSLAFNGQEALVKVESDNPDIIITDVMMPVMNGLEFTKSIKKNLNTSHIPIIMLTAKNTTDSEIQGLKTGADYYLSKPFNVEQLELIVKNIIESRNRMHRRYSGFEIPKPKEEKIVTVDEKFMTRIVEMIEEMIADPNLSVELMANKSNMSSVHLYRKIKALTGLSPNEFIRAFRLEKASHILQQNKMIISDVAYSVGFNDAKYFGKCFKKAYGLSPSEYNKKHNLKKFVENTKHNED